MNGERKYKFEVSRLGVVFIVLFALCLLVWTFVLGVWIGTKMGEKQSIETVKLEPQSPQAPSAQAPAPQASLPQASEEKKIAPSAGQSNQTNQTNQTMVAHQALSQEATSQVKPEKQPATEPKVEKEKQPKTEPKVEKERAKKEPIKTAKVQPQEKLKPQQEGQPFYALQVGAFSKKESAEKVRAEVERIGLKALVKESSQDGKMIYKVLAGRFESRERAEQFISKIESTLGIRPFVVEVK